MTNDPLDQLRLPADPARPDTRFAARLRARIVAELGADDPDRLPTIEFPERTPSTMTDTSTPADPTTVTTPIALTTYICVTPAGDAIDWYRDTLGAVETIRYTGDDGRVGHAELTIEGATLMLSDEYPELGVVAPTTLGGTPTTLHLVVADVDAVHARVTNGGGQAQGAPKDEAYGARSFSMLDPFGHRWMIQTPTSSPTLDELQAGSDGYTVTTSVEPTADPPAGATPIPTRPVELGYFTMAAPDTARAARFYGALFAWTTEPGNLGAGYAHIDNTKLPLGFTPGAADESPMLYFRVDDVPAAAARVRELGGEVISETTYDSGPNAACRDDQGREFQLWQPAPGYE